MQWFAQIDEVPARYVLQENMNVVIMFQVPLLALLCWMFFWKERLHYAGTPVCGVHSCLPRFVSGLRRDSAAVAARPDNRDFDSLQRIRGFMVGILCVRASQFYRGNRVWSAVKAVCVAVASQGLTILAVFEVSYVLSKLGP